ncbi:MAG: Rrf2 family transcriptional regulator, partial [Synergistaceae bacterium]|nr:Rrf2 family transcriptional regulator [Synergistaceae bacterium]
DYALRILRVLSDGEQVTVGDVCKRELLPQQFVYKILKKMEQAGLVRIARGAEGGCRLSADLEKVSLHDLITAMKTDRLVGACMQPGFQCAWQGENASSCTVHKQLQQIQEILDTELRKRSLRQMLFGNN